MSAEAAFCGSGPLSRWDAVRLHARFSAVPCVPALLIQCLALSSQKQKMPGSALPPNSLVLVTGGVGYASRLQLSRKFEPDKLVDRRRRLSPLAEGRLPSEGCNPVAREREATAAASRYLLRQRPLRGRRGPRLLRRGCL